MPLPFGGKPEDSPIYSDMKTKKLSELSATDFDSFRSRMFSEGINGLEDEYRRLLLLGMASDQISLSGPMPDTQKLVQITTTSNGYHRFFTPAAGEVWLCVGASISTNDGGTVVLKMYGGDAATSVELAQETAANVTFQPSFGADIYVDNNVQLAVSISSIVGTITCNAAFIRVR